MNFADARNVPTTLGMGFADARNVPVWLAWVLQVDRRWDGCLQ